MGTNSGVGYSSHRHFKAAAVQAVKEAFAKAGTQRADLVIVFAAIAYPQEQLLAAIKELVGDARLVGASGNGLIANQEAVEEPFYLGVMVIASDEMVFQVASATGLSTDPKSVGLEIGRGLSDAIDSDAKCVIAFADGLTLNFDRFEEGFREILGDRGDIPLFGGASGDDWKLERTYQYVDDKALTDGVVAISISGDVSLAYETNHGCMIIGEQRIVTKASGNVIEEIDGAPAYQVLSEYLNEDERKDWGKTVVNINLGFKEDVNDDEIYIRYMPAMDEATGAITIPTEVSAGTPV